jgi:hypothetical protein
MGEKRRPDEIRVKSYASCCDNGYVLINMNETSVIFLKILTKESRI